MVVIWSDVTPDTYADTQFELRPNVFAQVANRVLHLVREPAAAIDGNAAACIAQTNYNPDDEFKMNPLLNTALCLVMQSEFLLLRLGLRLSVGQSLLLLCRKP